MKASSPIDFVPGGSYYSAYEAGFCGYGSLRGIHIFDREIEELRSLNRTRFYLMRDLRRSKNRIKSFLQYYGEPIPAEFDNNQWTLKFLSWLKDVKMQTLSGQDAFSNLIRSYEYHRQ